MSTEKLSAPWDPNFGNIVGDKIVRSDGIVVGYIKDDVAYTSVGQKIARIKRKAKPVGVSTMTPLPSENLKALQIELQKNPPKSHNAMKKGGLIAIAITVGIIVCAGTTVFVIGTLRSGTTNPGTQSPANARGWKIDYIFEGYSQYERPGSPMLKITVSGPMRPGEKFEIVIIYPDNTFGNIADISIDDVRNGLYVVSTATRGKGVLVIRHRTTGFVVATKESTEDKKIIH